MVVGRGCRGSKKTLKLKGNRTSTCANQVGNGTTTVVLLAEEFLKEAKPFIEDGVHPQNLIQSFRTAAYSPTEMIKELASPNYRRKNSGSKEKFTRQMCCYDPIFEAYWWRKGVFCFCDCGCCPCNWL